ncbi:MAG TPA: DedA family protein [Thermoanaerobaculia bacterium]|nr:DedA family protein [Thermoanaerobaculia bacterium]
MLAPPVLVPLGFLHEPALQIVQEYLEKQSYFGVFFLLFLGAFGPSPPEEVVLLIAGFLVFRGVARFPYMVGAELAGIVLSDAILYGFGALFGGTLDRHRFMRRIFPAARVQKIQESFHRYRYRVIFLARYLYGLRPAVFFTAGATRMPLTRFLLVDAGASLLNCLVWTALGILLGERIEDAIRFSRQWEGILLGLAVALVLYFVAEQLLIRRKLISPRAFWVRQATGTKIAAVVATVLLAVLVGRFLFPHGVREGFRFAR